MAEVFESIARQGDFYFSYGSELLPADSLIHLSVREKPLKLLLETLLRGRGLEYLASGNYLIIRRPGRRMELSLQDIVHRGNNYLLSGRVTDLSSGLPVQNVTVYEKQLLLSALTKKDGSFRLRIQDRNQIVALTASKAAYQDTSMLVYLKGVVVLPAGQQRHRQAASFQGEGEGNPDVERSGLGRWLVSSRQRIQSINLRSFFTESPVQVSITPGLSSQGRMSAQVVNRFSFNLLGGYTAGVEGVELAGIYNMNKKDVEYLQVAGGFNIVGGKMRGVQIAGLHNIVHDSVNGVQAGGYNRVKADLEGLQAGGLNRVDGTVSGVQIGLVNIADSSAGASIGFLNIIRKNGLLRLRLNANESFPLNLALMSGTKKLYTILQGGMAVGPRKAYAYGLGLGREISFGRRGRWSLQPEFLFQEVYQGDARYNNHIYRLSSHFQYWGPNGLCFFAGPSLAVLNSSQVRAVEGYGFLPAAHKHSFDWGHRLQGWLGWSAGISFPVPY